MSVFWFIEWFVLLPLSALSVPSILIENTTTPRETIGITTNSSSQSSTCHNLGFNSQTQMWQWNSKYNTLTYQQPRTLYINVTVCCNYSWHGLVIWIVLSCSCTIILHNSIYSWYCKGYNRYYEFRTENFISQEIPTYMWCNWCKSILFCSFYIKNH